MASFGEAVIRLEEGYHYIKKPRDVDDFDTYEILVSDVHQSELVEQGIAKVNDVILVAPENQMGVHSYKVIIDKDGEKIAEPITDKVEEDEPNEESDEEPVNKRRRLGGKKNKSKKQRKSKKGGKTRKSKKERKTRKNRK